jgi:hypothetical protein
MYKTKELREGASSSEISPVTARFRPVALPALAGAISAGRVILREQKQPKSLPAILRKTAFNA